MQSVLVKGLSEDRLWVNAFVAYSFVFCRFWIREQIACERAKDTEFFTRRRARCILICILCLEFEENYLWICFTTNI